MREYRADYLLPGHTRAVIGSAEVETTLKNYRDALEYVLTETLHGMNEGRTPWQGIWRYLQNEIGRAHV